MPDDAISKSLKMTNMELQRRLWLQNVRSNLDVILSNKNISILEKLFEGLPGIVVGAGPSLEKNIDLIARNRTRYPLFCTDRAFKKLHAVGVIPHFTVVIDFQDEVADFFEGMPVDKSVLCVSVKASPRVSALPWRKKLYFLVFDNDKGFNQTLLNLTQRKLVGMPGGVVCGNTAYMLARWSGCNPIAFVGCDMSMKEPSPNPGDINYEAKDAEGNTLYSLPGYLAGFEWLLKHLRVDKEVVSGKVKVYNSTEGGIMYADILPGMPLKEFIDTNPGATSSLKTRIMNRIGA